MSDDRLILSATVTSPETLSCPIWDCDFSICVPAVPINSAVAAVFGLSGSTLAQVHADQEAKRAAHNMRTHLRGHQPEDWLLTVAKIHGFEVSR